MVEVIRYILGNDGGDESTPAIQINSLTILRHPSSNKDYLILLLIYDFDNLKLSHEIVMWDKSFHQSKACMGELRPILTVM